MKTGTIEKCGNCKKEFYCQKKRKLDNKMGVFCSKLCANKTIGKNRVGIKRPKEVGEKVSKKKSGVKFTELHKQALKKAHPHLIGKNSPHWKGGKDKKESHKEWRAKNWQKVLGYNNKRRVMRTGNGGSHTLGEWEHIKALYQWTCPKCWKKEPQIKLTRDHIVPLSKGGSDDIENIQPLCQSCNSSKNNKTIKYDR